MQLCNNDGEGTAHPTAQADFCKLPLDAHQQCSRRCLHAIAGHREVCEHGDGSGRTPICTQHQATWISPFFTSSSTSLAKKLTASWEGVGFKRKMHTRNVGVDTANGRRRRTTIADKRLKQSFRRAARLQQLRKAGGRVTSINRAGATAVALWGLAGIGLPPGKLHSLRLSTL
eukprot:3284014-Heterocapsa_arctica.AAC.1